MEDTSGAGVKVHGFMPFLIRSMLLVHVMWFGACFSSDSSASDSSASPRLTDVCIYAATPSGVLAAVAVAREGRSVIVVEPSRWVGGMLGAGIQPAEDCPEPAAVGGLAQQVFTNAGETPESVKEYFSRLLRENRIPIVFEHRLASLKKTGSRIESITLENAPPDTWGCPIPYGLSNDTIVIGASEFIDASYEGDLMAKAGCEYAVGREPAAAYDEEFAGVQSWSNLTPISPFINPDNPASGLLPLVESDHGKLPGEGDDFTQAYNFRIFLTSDPQKRIPIAPPEDYDPGQYELVGRYVKYLIDSNPNPSLQGIFPGWLNAGAYNYLRQSLISTAPLGLSRLYQDGDYPTRSRIWKMHIDYLRGLYLFMSSDPRVPREWREKVAQFGIDGTHFPDTEGWPNQLYVRVARRMIGRYILTEANVMNRTTVDDSIGLALYGIDVYPVRRVAVKDEMTGRWSVATEGDMFIGGSAGTGRPFPVPYRSITPKEIDCTNLLVTVCFSASYIAYAAARMEPVFMLLGESAGVAAAHAIDESTTVQAIDISKLRGRLKNLGQVLEWNK